MTKLDHWSIEPNWNSSLFWFVAKRYLIKIVLRVPFGHGVQDIKGSSCIQSQIAKAHSYHKIKTFFSWLIQDDLESSEAPGLVWLDGGRHFRFQAKLFPEQPRPKLRTRWRPSVCHRINAIGSSPEWSFETGALSDRITEGSRSSHLRQKSWRTEAKASDVLHPDGEFQRTRINPSSKIFFKGNLCWWKYFEAPLVCRWRTCLGYRNFLLA